VPEEAAKALRQRGAARPTAKVNPFVAVVLLADEMLADVAAEALCSKGVIAFDGLPEVPAVDLIAADAGHLAGAARRFPHARLIAVNLSGPDALVGDACRLKPKAFLKKPASAASLVSAVGSELHL